MTRWGKKLRLGLYPGALTIGPPFRVDLSGLPVDVNYTPSRWLCGLLFTVASGCAILAFWIIASHGQQIESAGIIAGIATLVTCLLAAICYLMLTTQRSAVFGPLDVIVHDVDGRDWRAKYRDMAGLRRCEISSRNGQGLTRYQLIEIVHPDAQKNLPLFYKRGEWSEDALLQNYAEILKLPVLPFTPARSGPRYGKDMRHVRG